MCEEAQQFVLKLIQDMEASKSKGIIEVGYAIRHSFDIFLDSNWTTEQTKRFVIEVVRILQGDFLKLNFKEEKLMVNPSVKDELLETDFYHEYKKEVLTNKGKPLTDNLVICELIYDLIREVAK